MPGAFIAFDAMIGFNSKLFNATKHDIGKGNIKVETAKRVYERNKINSWSELVDYLRTDEGTIHIATLVILRAQQLFKPYIKEYPEDLKEAVYVTLNWAFQIKNYFLMGSCLFIRTGEPLLMLNQTIGNIVIVTFLGNPYMTFCF